MIVSLKIPYLINHLFALIGAPDGNAIHTIANAHQAGIEYIDVYMFPSPRCSKSAAQQVSDMGKSNGWMNGWMDE